jgi:alpha-beta hydrolase superfamily lysophospholipase
MKQTEASWSSKGSKVHAVAWCPDTKTKAAVALVHGLGEHCQRYEALAEAFAAAGVAIVAFDLPGHGLSGGPRGHSSFAAIRVEIDRLLEEGRSRFPGLPLFLFGHSLGGLLVLDYLLERRPIVTGAIVSSPGLSPALPVSAAKLRLARIMAKVMPSFTLSNGLDIDGICRDAEVVREYRADPLVHGRISARLGIDLLEAGPKAIARAREIVTPLLLLQGGADRDVDPEATRRFAAAAGSNVTFRFFPEAYHELHNDPGKEEVLALEIGWILGTGA